MSNQTYFYSISGTVEVPHSPGEIVDLLSEGAPVGRPSPRIGARFKQHEQKIFFSRAERVRFVIPQNKKMLNKLESLITLNRQPLENRSHRCLRKQSSRQLHGIHQAGDQGADQ